MKLSKKGFTLIEVIAVVCIIGMLASLVIPKIQKHMNDANETKYYIDAKTINECVDIYNVENMEDQITDNTTLKNIKEKLTVDGNKKYIAKWPLKIKVGIPPDKTQILDESNLETCTYKSLCNYIETSETLKAEENRS